VARQAKPLARRRRKHVSRADCRVTSNHSIQPGPNVPSAARSTKWCNTMLGSACSTKVMRHPTCMWAALSCAVAFLSCGYTVLEKERPSTIRPATLPDLLIVGVTNKTDVVRWADNPEPVLTTQFWIRVVNRGGGLFKGGVAVAWADVDDDIRSQTMRHMGHEEFVLLAADSARTFTATIENVTYPNGTPLLFGLITDARDMDMNWVPYDFGARPVAEADLENNRFLYRVQ
jgi:hypothetical protein